MISDIEIMQNDANSLYESIRNNLGIWRERVTTKKQFIEEWQEFIIKSRKLIQKTTQIEENFFPKVSGDFGDSLEIAQSYQRALDEFMPTVKVNIIMYLV